MSQPTSAPTPGPRPPLEPFDRFLAAMRATGIRRRLSDRWVAGVCGGLADKLGVDPIVVRLAWIVLLLMGGFGFAAYFVLFAILADTEGQIPLEKAVRHGDASSVVLLIFAGLCLVSSISDLGGAGGWGGGLRIGDVNVGGILTVVALVALGFYAVQRSRSGGGGAGDAGGPVSGAPVAGETASPAAPPTRGATASRVLAARRDGLAPLSSTTTTSEEHTMATPTTSATPATQSAPTVPLDVASEGAPPAAPPTPPWSQSRPPQPPPPPRPRRPRPGAFNLVTIGLAAIAFGATWAAYSQWTLPGHAWPMSLAAALAVLGIGCLALGGVGRRVGMAGVATVFVGLLALGAISNGPGHMSGRWGDQTWAPTSVTNGQSFDHGVGDATLDLTKLPASSLTGQRISTSLNLGQLTVKIPKGGDIQVTGDVSRGELSINDDASGNNTQTVGSGSTALLVDAHVGTGQLNIEEVQR
ncbi:PspC domain-containing protein [Arsenicicoccus piscis]|uniref:PspC domain-containing protein n=1 Tax=Arsenicicoccus piscis TaxID=673954 RepID=UPI001F4C786C|nr:PspC domain-containing protein [Arsenicicoccus piscis]MCH8628147.1 PspC domain-containing protein [Arsenicicoccus piscis]